MKFIRTFFKLLLLAAVLAALLGAIAFIPGVQTWIAQQAIEKQPGLQLTFSELSAGIGGVEAEDVRWVNDGILFTAPSIEIGLPLPTAWWNRKAPVKTLVAKGWTLDLGYKPDPAEAQPQTTPPAEGEETPSTPKPPPALPAQAVARVFNGILSGWKLPYDLSLDGVDLEGEVLFPVGTGKERARLHVTITGGGLAAGREGSLAIEARGTFLNLGPQILDLADHARLGVTMDSPRTFNRVELKTTFVAKAGSVPEGLTFSTDFVVTRADGEETYSMEVSRSERHLATLLAHFPEAKHLLGGTWKTDLQASDFSPFVAEHALPELAASGEGDFEADAAFATVHLPGQLKIQANHLGVIAPLLATLGAVSLDTHFDLTQRGTSSHFAHLEASLQSGTLQLVALKSFQAFDFEAKDHRVTAATPGSDWIEGAISELPLSWLSPVLGGGSGVRFEGGNVSGAFTVQATDGGFVLHQKTPFIATNVSMKNAGSVVAQGMDLSLSLLAETTAQGWTLQSTPLTVSSGGRNLATLEAKAVQPAEADKPVTVAGKWNIDLEAMASQPVIPSLRLIRARSVSADFSATLGSSIKVDSDLVLVEQNGDDSIAVKLHTEGDPGYATTFRAPIKIKSGSKVMELSTGGSWANLKAAHRLDVTVTGKEVEGEQLRRLVTPFLGMLGGPITTNSPSKTGAPGTAAEKRDKVPFWGDLIGRIHFNFNLLKTGESEVKDVRATFKIDHTALKLETGQYVLPDHNRLGEMEGEVSFDPVAPSPYNLKATMDDGEVDAAPLFGAVPADQDPPFHGVFSVATTLTGSGTNLEDLIAHSQEEFRLKSKGGIVRLLKTSLAHYTPETAKPVSDAAVGVGTLVGKLFGMKRDSIESGEIHLSKNTESVLDFTYQVAEIGYSEITITATRGVDRKIHVLEFGMITPDEHVTGTGEISYVQGTSFATSPLSLDLKFGARGRAAELLSNTDLLSSEKDGLGFTLFKQPVHFGGTLQHLDQTAWHDMLVEAAAKKPEGAKKDSAPSPSKTKPEGSKP